MPPAFQLIIDDLLALSFLDLKKFKIGAELLTLSVSEVANIG